MTRLEEWFLKRIIAKEVKHGNHAERIAHLFDLIYQACKKEFVEDNAPTLNAFLLEQFTSIGQNK